MRVVRLIVPIALLAIFPPSFPMAAAAEEPAAKAAPSQASAESWLQPDPAALRRWQDMRFGMFIHWGPVSLTGQEIGWSRGRQTPIEEYDNLYKKFNPTEFDADQWVAVAKAAGMKYMVLTTKHHDGFCLWDTKQTDYNIMHTPFGRDVVKELAEACRRGGIAFGAYYSVCDWRHPDFPLASPGGKVRREKSDIASYRKYLRSQVRELITGYGPLLTMWYDVPQEFDAAEGRENIRVCRTLQPDLIINNRAGGRQGDYDTPEQYIGGFNMERPWETCMTICHQWAWKPNDAMKSLPECLHTLIRTVGGDGNLLFNVGPMPDGQIEPRQVERLKEMGQWLEKYGESIYGTRGGPIKPSKNLVTTRRGKTIYAHVLGWPDDALLLPPLPAKIVGSRVLTGGEATVIQTDDAVRIMVPPADRQEIDTIIQLELDTPAMQIPPMAASAFGASLTTGKQVRASSVFQDNAAYAAGKAVDGDEHTRWATDAETTDCWLEVDLGNPVTFDRALLDEWVGAGPRVRTYQLQQRQGDAWKTFFQGQAMGQHRHVRFEPVTARHVRLVIEGRGGPTIHEFQLFAPSRK